MISSMKWSDRPAGSSFSGLFSDFWDIARSRRSVVGEDVFQVASRLQGLDIPLDDQDLFLFQVALQFFLELSEESPRDSLVRRDDAEDDDLVAVDDITHPPVPLVVLGEEG